MRHATVRRPRRSPLEALLVSVGIVALGEIGDKTQLLALVLAARYGRPVPIILGILVATALNHALAGALGAWIRLMVAPELLRWALALGFFAMALWALRPDTLDEETPVGERRGVFVITLVAFFLAEMGDKTPIATVALAAKYDALATVVVGTTLGMLLANVPVVLLARRAAARIPFRVIRYVTAALFLATGVLTLVR
jgi:putative Ca2+/H+ antiporter (TMEM165/GDT1 family)